jgi:hypothetical protein
LQGVSFHHCVDRSLLAHEPIEELCRLGSANDGGYVVPRDAILSARHLLSFGVATNWDFERAAAAMNPYLTVDAYDPSVGSRRFVRMALRGAFSVPLRAMTADLRGARSSLRKLGTALDYFRFFSKHATHTARRVWYNDDRQSIAIAEILATAERRSRVPMFAKIDIEGSEYRVLPWIIDAAELFTGLVIEFHHTDICAALFNAQLARLLGPFRVVHVHGNNYGDMSVDGSLPLTLEISFLHRSIAATTAGSLDKRLDAPNDPARPDFALDLAGRR